VKAAKIETRALLSPLLPKRAATEAARLRPARKGASSPFAGKVEAAGIEPAKDFHRARRLGGA
jgi:hypothetical protein